MTTLLHISRRAEIDMTEILRFTEEHFGKKQRIRYEKLLEQALVHLVRHPQKLRARVRVDIGPEIYVLHLSKKDQKASHFVVCQLHGSGKAEVLRVLHDAMDIGRQL